ncbi:hypothetical protein [Thermoleptolyngbya sp. M55_K2018_002]|uniref:hypothetical protein n=1 Tax=Thermoleptolyngbya sp. M55_K2018_002 TaxID=2747808 RepID=UPI001A0E42E0|nr:hypothetical protein [Thermoleptolyngbya sp. M55_K2018_002]HIK41714.1 hypothetical protein [Thermoleptolyngbya sp. M55_K2018_002]
MFTSLVCKSRTRFAIASTLLAAALLAGCGSAPWLSSAPVESPAASPAASPSPSEPSGGAIAQSPAATLDTTIVPGERFGPVTKNTTRQDLAAQFGEANLEDKEIGMGEGETELGTVVNLGPERSFTIIWGNPERTEAAAVMNPGPAWQTPEGIGVGTSFAELQQTLGPFKFYGFDWDYGGTVLLEGTELRDYYGLLVMRLHMDDAARTQSASDYQALIGDELFESSNPHAQKLNLTVGELLVSLRETNN